MVEEEETVQVEEEDTVQVEEEEMVEETVQEMARTKGRKVPWSRHLQDLF